MTLLKRYGMPLVLSVVLYSATYFIFGEGSRYSGVGLALAVLLAYLIRICDDIGDYEKDRRRGKAPIRRELLIILCALAAVGVCALALLRGVYLMIIPVAVIAAQLLIKEKYRDIIKPLFLPVTVTALVLSFFTPNLWLSAVLPALIIIDVILIVYKRKK